MHRSILTLLLAGLVVVAALPAVGSPARAGDEPAPGGVRWGLRMWLDASDPDANGNPADDPADGAVFRRWADRSGNGNHAVVRPNKNPGTYRTAPDRLINGSPVVRFTRVSNVQGTILYAPDLDVRPVAMEDLTVFAVYRPTSTSPDNGVWGNDDGNWDRFFIAYHPYFGNRVTDGVVGLGPRQGGQTIPDSGVVGEVRLLTVRYSGNVQNGQNNGPQNGSAVWFDGKLQRRFTDSTHPTDAQRSFAIGWDGDNSVFDGEIAEVIVYDRPLPDEALDRITAYLARKYGPALDLDTPATVSAPSRTMTWGDTPPDLGPATGISDVDPEDRLIFDVRPTCVVLDPPSPDPIVLTEATPAGTYTVRCSGGEASGYILGTYLDGVVEVTPRELAVVPFDQVVVEGDPVPEYTFDYLDGGFGGTPVDADLATPPTCGSAYTTGSGPGTLTISCGGDPDGTAGSDPNHVLDTSATATLTVIATADPAIELEVRAPGAEIPPVEGLDVGYRFVVTSSGTTPVDTAPTVTSDRVPAIDCPDVDTTGDGDDRLDPGETLVCRGDATVTAEDIATGRLVVDAEARAGALEADATRSTPVAPFVAVLLDASRSAGESAPTIVGLYNDLLRDLKSRTRLAPYTLAKFSSRGTVRPYDGRQIAAIPVLTGATFRGAGETPLFDAAVREIRRFAAMHPDGRVLFGIVTDGWDTASTSETAGSLAALIRTMERDHGWRFFFRGSRLDTLAAAVAALRVAEQAAR